jgi:Zn-dependent metalloprotease
MTSRDVANTIILEAQFGFAPDTQFADAAQIAVDVARSLYGAAASETVRSAFQARGIL